MNFGKQARLTVWYKLIERWTTGRIAGVVEWRPDQIFLNVYRRLDNGKFEQSAPNVKGAYFVNLQELKPFLKQYQIEMPEMLTDSYRQNLNESKCDPESLKNSDGLILQNGVAAEKLHNLIRNQLYGIGKNLTSSTAADRQNIAVSQFDENPDVFFPIKRQQIDGRGPYEANDKHRRKMVGMVIMLANIPGAGSDHEALYDRFLMLKTSE